MIGRRTLLGAGVALSVAPAFAKADPVATGKTGRWQGKRDGGVAAFLGIRYGQDTRRHRSAIRSAPCRLGRPVRR